MAREYGVPNPALGTPGAASSGHDLHGSMAASVCEYAHCATWYRISSIANARAVSRFCVHWSSNRLLKESQTAVFTQILDWAVDSLSCSPDLIPCRFGDTLFPLVRGQVGNIPGIIGAGIKLLDRPGGI
jgi:hypothetical protein